MITLKPFVRVFMKPIRSNQYPYHPCIYHIYLRLVIVNVGNYTILLAFYGGIYRLEYHHQWGFKRLQLAVAGTRKVSSVPDVSILEGRAGDVLVLLGPIWKLEVVIFFFFGGGGWCIYGTIFTYIYICIYIYVRYIVYSSSWRLTSTTNP